MFRWEYARHVFRLYNMSIYTYKLLQYIIRTYFCQLRFKIALSSYKSHNKYLLYTWYPEQRLNFKKYPCTTYSTCSKLHLGTLSPCSTTTFALIAVGGMREKGWLEFRHNKHCIAVYVQISSGPRGIPLMEI